MSKSKSTKAERERRLKETALALGLPVDHVRALRRRYPGACKATKHLPKAQRDGRIAAALGLSVAQLETFRRAESASVTSRATGTRRPTSRRPARSFRVIGPIGPIPTTKKRRVLRVRGTVTQSRAQVAGRPPSIPVCESCDRPIKPTGKCGCL